MSDAPARIARRAGVVLTSLLAVAVLSAVVAILAPIVLAALRIPIPSELWQAHSVAMGGGVALLGKLLDTITRD